MNGDLEKVLLKIAFGSGESTKDQIVDLARSTLGRGTATQLGQAVQQLLNVYDDQQLELGEALPRKLDYQLRSELREAVESLRAALRANDPPDGYVMLPNGNSCRCVKLWHDAFGNTWCCNSSGRRAA